MESCYHAALGRVAAQRLQIERDAITIRHLQATLDRALAANVRLIGQVAERERERAWAVAELGRCRQLLRSVSAPSERAADHVWGEWTDGAATG